MHKSIYIYIHIHIYIVYLHAMNFIQPHTILEYAKCPPYICLGFAMFLLCFAIYVFLCFWYVFAMFSNVIGMFLLCFRVCFAMF